MMEWCLAHPWMTFFICMFAIEAIEAIGVAFFKRTKDNG